MGPVSSEPGAERRTGLMKQPLDLELPVVAMGARPGDKSEKRELFTETTETVLVFENGCVIQLAAAVAVGQLVFLTNKETGEEIVTQVLRKRSHRPTDCYVELEFTEPAPDFWGQEFPDIEAPGKMDLSEGGDAATVSESEVTEEDTNQVVAPPDAAEVERLRKEVEALRAQLRAQTEAGESTPNQDKEAVPQQEEALGDLARIQQPSVSELASLKSLLGPKTPANELEAEEEKPAAPAQDVAKLGGTLKETSSAPTTISSEKIELMSPHEQAPAVSGPTPSAVPPAESTPAPTTVPAEEPSYPIRMQLPKAEGESARTSEFAADSAAITAAQDENLLPTPSLDFEQFPGVARQNTKLFSRGARRSLSGPIGALVAIVLLLVAAGIMTYRMGWLSDLGGNSSKAADNSHSAFPANAGSANSKPANTATTETAKPDVPESGTSVTHATGGNGEVPTANTASSTGRLENVGEHAATPVESRPVSKGNSRPVEKRNSKHTSTGHEVTATSQPVMPDDGPVVPPKLVRAIKSLSPPEALRGYISGKVTLDALVDETGHVISAIPISGPKALYKRAVDTAMQYEYLPATKGGKPVQAHAPVVIQFWYEP